jgi:hypothetical protein
MVEVVLSVYCSVSFGDAGCILAGDGVGVIDIILDTPSVLRSKY